MLLERKVVVGLGALLMHRLRLSDSLLRLGRLLLLVLLWKVNVYAAAVGDDFGAVVFHSVLFPLAVGNAAADAHLRALLEHIGEFCGSCPQHDVVPRGFLAPCSVLVLLGFVSGQCELVHVAVADLLDFGILSKSA